MRKSSFNQSMIWKYQLHVPTCVEAPLIGVMHIQIDFYKPAATANYFDTKLETFRSS